MFAQIKFEELVQQDQETGSRIVDALLSIIDGKLPKYSCGSRAEYLPKSDMIVIPFENDPLEIEVEAVAYHFARFVHGRTNKSQSVTGHGIRDSLIGVMYYIQDSEHTGPPFKESNARVCTQRSNNGPGLVCIQKLLVGREGIEGKVLVDYVYSLHRQQV